jgi:hypothetical protein
MRAQDATRLRETVWPARPELFGSQQVGHERFVRVDQICRNPLPTTANN